jgi:hypothetical protein
MLINAYLNKLTMLYIVSRVSHQFWMNLKESMKVSRQ